MGGIIILLSITVSVLMWSDFNTDVMLPILFIMLSFGFIGFIDDYSKVAKNTSNGISGKIRLLLQALSVCIFIYWTSMLLNIEDLNLLTLPLLKDVFINLGYFSIPLHPLETAWKYLLQVFLNQPFFHPFLFFKVKEEPYYSY